MAPFVTGGSMSSPENQMPTTSRWGSVGALRDSYSGWRPALTVLLSVLGVVAVLVVLFLLPGRG
jgi:hypothetical protein